MAQTGTSRSRVGQNGGEASKYVTAGMDEVQIAAAIEESREQGWSEVADHVRGGAAGTSWSGDLSEEDQLLWEKLKEEAPDTFVEWGERVKLGQVIAEGGQAHIYEALIDGFDRDFVAKVFKMEGFSLVNLHRQLPRTTKSYHGEGNINDFYASYHSDVGEVVIASVMKNCNHVWWGTFLRDGRFAFMADRCWGDLRTLINSRMKDNNYQGLPFSDDVALRIMHDIARGMKCLNGRGILHRDLKAANVLIPCEPYSGRFSCYVADYESSMLVQGTGFWRAPEVLENLLKKECDRNKEIWTEKVDVYGYAMTCYEVLTGRVPFFGYVKSDWKRIIDGERPHLPDYVDPEVRELVEKCWHNVPSERPTFDSIVDELRCML